MVDFNFYFFCNLIIIGVFNSFLYFNITKISKIINLYDYPDSPRKLHKVKTPLLGGVFIFFSIQLFIILLYFKSEIALSSFYFYSFKSIITFFISFYSIFLIGFLDDKYSISPDKKLILLFIFSYLFVLSDNTVLIDSIRIDFLNLNIDINKFAPIFTSLVIISFMMASNMFDGTNGQSSCFFIFTLLGLIFFNEYILVPAIILIFILLFFLFFNLKSKIFLGDNGVFILSFIISIFYIKTYNIYQSINFDHLILISLIPITDLIRVSIFRISQGKNPMKPDRSHFHHLLPSNNIRLIKIQIITIMPIIIYFVSDNILPSFFIPFLIYLYLIIKK